MTKKLIYLITITVGALVLVVGYSLYNFTQQNKAKTYIIEEETVLTEPETEVSTIIVYITGAVNEEGLYSMNNGSRVNDLIEKAGGFKDNADIGDINLAEYLKDEQKINVKYSYDKVDKTENLSQNSIQETELVNINTAGFEELKTLAGVGDKIAGAIIAYREKYGNFDSVEELKEVEGIGNNLFNKIKDNITLTD